MESLTARGASGAVPSLVSRSVWLLRVSASLGSCGELSRPADRPLVQEPKPRRAHTLCGKVGERSPQRRYPRDLLAGCTKQSTPDQELGSSKGTRARRPHLQRPITTSPAVEAPEHSYAP